MKLADKPMTGYDSLRGVQFRFVKNKLRNLLWDLRHGGWYGGIKRSPHPGANSIMSSDVVALDQLLTGLPKEDPVVDVGVGRGRVVRWLLAHGHTGPIIGVEIDGPTARRAKRHFRKHKQVEIIHSDIADCLRPEWRYFYCFNALRIDYFLALLKKIEFVHPEGGATICYYNPRIVKVDDQEPRLPHQYLKAPWRIRYRRLARGPNLDYAAYLVLPLTSPYQYWGSQAGGSR